MTNEIFTEDVSELALNIVQTELQSVRKKNISKTAFRVMDGEKIGIYGKIGETDQNAGFAKAKDNLTLNIPYPYEATENIQREEHHEGFFKSEHEFVEEMKILLESIKKKTPNFSFSHKLKLSNVQTSLKNDKNTSLLHRCQHHSIQFSIKEKSSSNIMDLFYGFDSVEKYDRAIICQEIHNACETDKNPSFAPHVSCYSSFLVR